jgi:DNA-binding IclR family transcriptional regulator
VLDRVFGILDALAEDGAGVALSDLARKLDLHRSTVHRLLVVLEGRRYVEKDSASGKYRLGSKLLELGTKVAARLDLPAIARPFLEQLVRETGETAHMGVLRQGEVLSIANVESSRTLHTPRTVGRRTPAHCSSLGKCLLAFLPDRDLNEFLEVRGLKAYTISTITSPEVLKAELRRVRERGYAVDEEEYEEGLKCVGAPVRDHSGAVIAAVSIAGPAPRLREGRMPALADSVVRAAAGLSEALGYRSEQKGSSAVSARSAPAAGVAET